MTITFANEHNIEYGQRLVCTKVLYKSGEPAILVGQILTINEITSDAIRFRDKDGELPMEIIKSNNTLVLYDDLDEEELFLYSIGGVESLVGRDDE